MTELLPCPFCGSPADPNSLAGPFGERLIQCSNCGCGAGLSGACWQATHNQAVEAWNTRHIPEGYTLVPVEPTEDMLAEGENQRDGEWENLASIYKAMIKAAGGE